MSREYPWYEVVEGESLEQGDILQNCPVLVPTVATIPTSSDTLPAEVLTFDVVVMTQSCDLENEKVEDVVLCPHWDLETASEMDAALGRKGALKSVAKGYRPRYAMLQASEFTELPMSPRVVDLGRVFSLPKIIVGEIAANRGRRLRLSPPYREHLSQAFARFYMRVALPNPINIE